ncbi:endonuclease/exonuclease/phosphatase family protein [Aquamicrobium segne]|uniref:Endonuclease/exonuclease/phosphatase family protein n=1 Tax=Aquamicrobium segne TaxID=469547 RepID=A0ABW0GY14_9HYPH
MTRLLLASLFGSSLALLLGFFNSLHPTFDSFAHFRVHLALLTIMLSLILFPMGQRIVALSALVFALGCLSSVTQVMRLPSSLATSIFPQQKTDRATYRLLEINLRYNNPTPEKVLSLIGQVQPDVLTLMEASPLWTQKLNILRSAYPHRIGCHGRNPRFGVVILSRRPFSDDRPADCNLMVSFALAPVDFGGTIVNVGAVHLGWPWPFNQAQQVSELENMLQTLDGKNTIIAGDLNATPWSVTAARIAAAGGLALVPSPGPTWIYHRLPASLLFFGLPIDNVFASSNIMVHSIERLQAVGSDHVPVLVKFSIENISKAPDGETESTTVWLQ